MIDTNERISSQEEVSVKLEDRVKEIVEELSKLDVTEDVHILPRPSRANLDMVVMRDTIEWKLKTGEKYLMRLRSA